MIWVIIGILIIRYTFPIVQMFGTITWAEEHLRGGFGGTYTFIKLIGLTIIILALLYAFNAIGFLIKPLGSVFGG
jgi:hypothetical protein